MKEFIKKHWVNGLGISFLFLAFLYFMKLAINQGWFPVEARIGSSTVLGVIALFSGFKLYQKGRKTIGEVLAGLGAGILYAVTGYVGLSVTFDLSSGMLMIIMVAICFLTAGVAVRNSLRILFVISLIGGLITPLVINAADDNHLSLFIYVILLDIGAFYVAATKRWKENMVIAFLLSMMLYCVHYVVFDLFGWERPFFYLSTFFVVAASGFIYSSIRQNKKYDGIELLFGALNAVSFLFWSFMISTNDSQYIIPFIVVGVVFLATAVVIYHKSGGKARAAFVVYTGLGILFLAIAGSDLSQMYNIGNISYAITALVWLFIVTSVNLIGRKLKDPTVVFSSLVGFIGVLIYWYSVAWGVDWIPIFGVKYIPFLNLGALIWIGMVFLGFSFAKYVSRGGIDPLGFDKKHIASLMALVSHLIVGGLLTIQVMNLWDAYELSFIDQDLSLSLVCFFYALYLTIWANRNEHGLFEIAGGLVLLASSIKVVFWDLSGESSVQKIIFLMLLGGTALLIGFLRSKKKKTTMEIPEKTEAGSGSEDELLIPPS